VKPWRPSAPSIERFSRAQTDGGENLAETTNEWATTHYSKITARLLFLFRFCRCHRFRPGFLFLLDHGQCRGRTNLISVLSQRIFEGSENGEF